MKLRVENFGPVRGGFGDFMEFAKVTLFCGPQGSGKSSVTKLASLLSWLEKSVYRNPELRLDAEAFEQALRWQGIASYLKAETEIEYCGDVLHLTYNRGEVKAEMIFDDRTPYVVPKISYMPAERNFASIVRAADRVEGLPRPLVDMQVEFNYAKNFYAKGYRLPANGFSFQFDKDPWIVNGTGANASRTRIEEASSGLQSMVPLLLVSEFLSSHLAEDDSDSSAMGLFYDPGTSEKKMRIDAFKREIASSTSLSADQKRQRLELYFAPGRRFLNIVEEPEQNLFPATQCEVIDKLLAIANTRRQNSLVISTHSPYIVNHLQLVAQAEEIARKAGMTGSVLRELPIAKESLASASDMRLYELHADGSITLSQGEDGFISDANPLNRTLAEFNSQYAQLFEIEDTHA